MAPDPHTIVAVALGGPWTLDDLTVRLAPWPGWGGSDEVGDVVALLLARWPLGPRGDPPPSARRRDHVAGRMSWVATAHPGRAARLRTLFDAIDWA